MRSVRSVFFLLLLFGLGPGSTASAQASEASPWEDDIRAFEEADRLGPPRPGGVLFAGSSSIRLWASLAEDFPGVPVLNRGFGGSQVSDVVRYADRIVLPYRPRTVVVYSGENDLAAGKTPEQVTTDYRRLVEAIHEALPRTRVVIVSVKPSIARWHLLSRIRRTNALLRRFAETDRRLRFVDVYTPMMDGGRPRHELLQADLLHMNERGYALWTQLVKPHL